MSKGIKMRSAKDRRGNVCTVEALQKQVDAGATTPSLVCDDPVCGCEVRFVPRYQQNRANRVEPVNVPAYIGLTRGSEHVAGCRYDAPGRLKIIAAQSDPDFLQALEDGGRELRLLALHNGLRQYGLSGVAPTGPRLSANPSQTSIQVIRSQKKLDSYLRTTADLLSLRALCETDAVLSSELTLRLGAKRIPWKQFFFEHENFDDAWEQVSKGGNNPYPVALLGTVQSCRPPVAGAAYKSTFLNIKPLYRKTDDPLRIETFEVSVAHVDSTWLSSFPIGSEVVIFGLWEASSAVEKLVTSKSTSTPTTTYVTHKLKLRLKFKKQLVAVS